MTRVTALALMTAIALTSCTDSQSESQNTSVQFSPNSDLSNAFDGRTVVYRDAVNKNFIGTQQSWSGNITYFDGGEGEWTLAENRYCSIFDGDRSNPDNWQCYFVLLSTDQTHILFTGETDKSEYWLARYTN